MTKPADGGAHALPSAGFAIGSARGLGDQLLRAPGFTASEAAEYMSASSNVNVAA